MGWRGGWVEVGGWVSGGGGVCVGGGWGWGGNCGLSAGTVGTARVSHVYRQVVSHAKSAASSSCSLRSQLPAQTAFSSAPPHPLTVVRHAGLHGWVRPGGGACVPGNPPGHEGGEGGDLGGVGGVQGDAHHPAVGWTKTGRGRASGTSEAGSACKACEACEAGRRRQAPRVRGPVRPSGWGVPPRLLGLLRAHRSVLAGSRPPSPACSCSCAPARPLPRSRRSRECSAPQNRSLQL